MMLIRNDYYDVDEKWLYEDNYDVDNVAIKWEDLLFFASVV